MRTWRPLELALGTVRAGIVMLMAVCGVSATVAAQTVASCPEPSACAKLSVGNASGRPGEVVTIPVEFQQGAPNGSAGGIDEIAAIAFSLSIGPNLRLADCSEGENGLPASVRRNPAISNFRVVVENYTCTGGRTHCLCPTGGETPDPFVNVVVYGPDPLPTPGPNPVEIPTLPAGPQELFTIDLLIGPGASGVQPLHVYTETRDSSRPQYTAFLSVGDRLAVDQTCIPVQGAPPCQSSNPVSQVIIEDGAVDVAGVACVGDCNGNGEVTIEELIAMVNIALGSRPVSDCAAGDESRDGEITIEEIVKAVNNALNGCSTN
ncbi:MAG: hypothetical protein KatS3mg077_3048 [Candidatus Binatia bacterium]|nr:MAG: hypothetical protein KatS3mg077_3048 [Candidatus Binatia bacterium]